LIPEGKALKISAPFRDGVIAGFQCMEFSCKDYLVPVHKVGTIP